MLPLLLMTIGDESDRELIQRLFLQNERSMYAMAMSIVKEHHTACDIVSAACEKMIEKIDYLRKIDPQKQTPYILSIVKNTALMDLRKRRRESIRTVAEGSIFDKLSAADDIDDALICEAESQMLQCAMNRLKPQERDLLVMKYFAQMDDENIGKQLGIGKNSVRYYLTMARRALKSELKEDLHG